MWEMLDCIVGMLANTEAMWASTGEKLGYIVGKWGSTLEMRESIWGKMGNSWGTLGSNWDW